MTGLVHVRSGFPLSIDCLAHRYGRPTVSQGKWSTNSGFSTSMLIQG
jgi:hypothetical protein